MAMPQPRAFPHIVRIPGIVGGEPTIKGTRISVQAVVEYFRIYRDVNRIHQALPHVSVAMLEEALAFYDSNREEIDRYIAEDEGGELEMTTRQPTTFARIVRDPRIIDGEPTVKGSRVPVRSIVILHRLYHTVDRLLEAFPHLVRDAIQQALAFYEANQEEIDRHIADNETDDD